MIWKFGDAWGWERSGCGFVPNIMALMSDDGSAGCMLLKGLSAAGILKLIAQPELGNNMYGEILGPEMETKMHSYRRMASTFSAVSEFQMQNRVIDLLTPAVWLNLHRAQRSLLFSCAGDTRNFLNTIGLLVEVSEPYMLHLPNKHAPTLTRRIIL